MTKKNLGMREKMRLAMEICEEECNILFLEGEVVVSFDHYSPEVHTIFLREDKASPRRVEQSDIKCISDRIRSEVDPRWNVNFIASRPEKFAWYTGDNPEDFLKKETFF
jgi:hypothetical protein